MDFPIVTTKLYIPHAPGSLVEREHLLEKIGVGVDNSARLILVCAPAGFGKSTLVSAWVETQTTPAAWLSLDEQDDTPERFFAYLIAAIQRVHPGFADDLSQQIQRHMTSDVENLLPALVNAFGEIPSPLLVTLDDYHAISNPIIHDSLTFLLEHVPNGVTFLIATRVMPPLSLARFRARRQLVDIRLQDLRFQRAEISQLFNELYALDLAEPEIAAMEARTEGWAAGLQLAVLALQAESDNRQEFIQRFSGSHEYIADYLVEEVLSRQPVVLTNFLLQTSILDRFCAPLCQALTGEAESEAILNDLFARNVFLIPLDSERRWFRYHHLFADLLSARLKNAKSAALPELHAKASTWFESNGHIQEAMNHALAGRDFLTVERIVRDNWTSMLHQGSVSVTLRWLNALPRMASQPNLMPDVVQSTLDWFATLPQKPFETYASLNNAYAWTLFLNGQLDEAEVYLQRSEQALERMLADGRLQKNDEEYREVNAGIKVLLVYLLHARHELDAALQLANKDLPVIQSASNLLRGNLQLVLGHVYRGLNQFEQAIKAYRAGIPLVWQGSNTIGTLSAYAGLISVYHAQSDFLLAEQTFQEALELMKANRIERIPAAGILYLERAVMLLAQNKPAEASSALDMAKEVAQDSGLWDFQKRCDTLRARLTANPINFDQSALIEPLTARELEVLKLLSNGCSNQDIADKLVISLATAKKHASSILSKLDAANRTQAIARAREIGIL
jgi:LuxR family transcriptional regulator, maltose regulon positive regulatory protein